ncbi:MAG: histidine phosphatase family protein [Lachnospiraceae bacterium]|nr:histidine phosphatase family protein [Lachnospiraceae bacterium]
MKIYLTRHGQTNLNKKSLMQGLTDEPLNEKGLAQAGAMRERLGGLHFDAVYASPLDRAVMTGAIIGGVAPSEVIRDPRLIEADFGNYEKKKFYLLGPFMMSYWLFPELFPAPKSVETVDSLRRRSASFLRELEGKEYETVLVACHGGIMRALSGYLEDRKNGLLWRPKPRNCEVRVYEAEDGRHRTLEKIRLQEK